MSSSFAIVDWSAFAPGLDDRAAWQAWAIAPFLPRGEAVPGLPEMAAMQRRRVDRLGRMALQVAWRCQPDAEQGTPNNIPIVFASRHGDLGRTWNMLCDLARDEALSPTHFGLSTHNAIAAQYSIARTFRDNCVCVAAGEATAEAAFVEALGLLADGAGEVLVVVYDEPVPAGYAAGVDEPQAGFAWAARIRSPAPGDAAVRLDVGQASPDSVSILPRELPHALEVLHFLIGAAPTFDYSGWNRTWRWRRDA